MANGMTYVDALIIVDVQNDFCPGGNLAVPRGDTILPKLVQYIEEALAAGIPVFASRDWHPQRDGHAHTVHFDTWPDHCVQGTRGAEFRPEIKRYEGRMRIVTKGDNLNDDGYSAFEGRLDPENGETQGKTLGQALRENGVTRLFVGGLATDYCVKETVLDALDPYRTRWRGDHDNTALPPLTPEQAAHGKLAVVLLSDASLPVEVAEGDGERAVKAMLRAGASEITIEQFSPTPRKEVTTAGDANASR